MGKQIKVVSDLDINNSVVTNANIDAQNNTIANLEVSNFKSGVIQTTLRDSTDALDTAIPTEKAVRTAIDTHTVTEMVGADGTNAGASGTVPAPAATDNVKYLKGDGTWDTVDALPSQAGQNGKFLTTNGSTASWTELEQHNTQILTFNGPLTSNTLSLNTEIDLSESIILSVYVNGVYQIDSTNYSITTSNEESTITFSSAFNENVTISIVYATDVNLVSISYNNLTDKPTIDTLLPTQTGNSGKFLTTNGTTAGWATVSSGTTDYTDLSNKPSINGVTLTGDVSLSSLGVQSKNLVFENTTADSWVISDPNVYPDYVYECTVSCPGATTNSFAQVVFGPGEFDSGNYANVCSTGQDSVTMYSKVNDTINIPTIIIMGV